MDDSMRIQPGVLSNTASQIFTKIIGAGTTLIVTLLIARQFGTIGYGDFIKVTTYVSFFFLLADFGFNAAFLQRHKELHAFPALLGTRIIAGFCFVFIALSLLSFLPRGQDQGYTDIVRLGIIIFSPAIIFQALITTANAIFQKHLRYGFSLLSVAAGSIITLLALWLLLPRAGYAGIIGPVVLLIGSIATAIAALAAVKKIEQSITVTFSPTHLTPLFFASLPLGLTLLFNVVYGHIDSVILTLTRGTSEVGIYGLAYKVFELILVVPTFFMNATYPLLLEAKNNATRFRMILRSSLLFLGITSLAMVLIVWIFAPVLTVIRDDFSASVVPLRTLSLSLPFFFITSVVMWTLVALKKQTWLMIIYGGSMIGNILLNLWLIPRYGYNAAAWVTVLSEGIVLLLSGSFLTRLLARQNTVK